MWPQSFYPASFYPASFWPKFGFTVPPFDVDLCTTTILETGRTHTIRSFSKSINDLMGSHTIKDC
jgi:hypothetical protein